MSVAADFTGFAFPPTSNVPDTAKPKPIYHVVYKLRQASDASEQADGLPEKSIRLFKQDETPKPPKQSPGADVKAEAKKILDGGGDYADFGASKVHIDLDRQCWVIVELDPKTNWRFSRSMPGVTTKKSESDPIWPANGTHGFNTELTYLFDDGTFSASCNPPEVPAHVDCHILFFKVMRRVEGVPCDMNFHVELYRRREGGKPEGRAIDLVPLIIDPQVPEDPPQTFP